MSPPIGFCWKQKLFTTHSMFSGLNSLSHNRFSHGIEPRIFYFSRQNLLADFELSVISQALEDVSWVLIFDLFLKLSVRVADKRIRWIIQIQINFFSQIFNFYRGVFPWFYRFSETTLLRLCVADHGVGYILGLGDLRFSENLLAFKFGQRVEDQLLQSLLMIRWFLSIWAHRNLCACVAHTSVGKVITRFDDETFVYIVEYETRLAFVADHMGSFNFSQIDSGSFGAKVIWIQLDTLDEVRVDFIRQIILTWLTLRVIVACLVGEPRVTSRRRRGSCFFHYPWKLFNN